MNYLIDGGTHLFQGIKKLNEIYKFDNSWEIYSFEPNPITFELSEQHKPNLNTNIIHINGALSTFDGQTIIHCERTDNYTGQGSNILKNPPTKDNNYQLHYSHYNIKTYNICNLINNLNNIDKLIIKLDIEGEEFNILPLIIDGCIHKHRINTMYIEFHERFFLEEITKYTNNKLLYIDALKKQNIDVFLWD